MHEDIDLARYFERIGYDGPCEPTADVLHALTRAHVQAIPFENIDVLLRRRISLQPRALFRKMVESDRGGYCFEQNGLFLEILARLGFEVTPRRAGVRLGQPDRDLPVAHTHMVLAVHIDDQRWLADVGVGAASLTCALRLEADVEQQTPHETRRLTYAHERWFHQIRRDGQWVDVYEFGGEAMPLPDRIVGNWYTSTHPDSTFFRGLTVARALPEGRRLTLDGAELKLRHPDGSADRRVMADRKELIACLRNEFGIRVPVGADFMP